MSKMTLDQYGKAMEPVINRRIEESPITAGWDSLHDHIDNTVMYCWICGVKPEVAANRLADFVEQLYEVDAEKGSVHWKEGTDPTSMIMDITD